MEDAESQVEIRRIPECLVEALASPIQAQGYMEVLDRLELDTLLLDNYSTETPFPYHIYQVVKISSVLRCHAGGEV